MKGNDIKNILVPLDFSEASLNSLETAIVLAKQHEAKIILLNVVDSSFMFAFKGVYYISEKTIESIVDISVRMLKPLLSDLKERHRLECASEIKVGLVPQSISKVAIDNEVDLIIMGSHGVSGFREFFIGTTAQNVVKISSCPVLIIPPTQKWIHFKKILFPLRPIDGQIEKYDFLRKSIKPAEAAIDILVLASTYDEKEKKVLQNLVKELKKKSIKDNIKISGTLKIGFKMPQAVLKMSKSIDADMIAITSLSNLDHKQIYIGPFEQHIVNHATMPVLSVKPKLAIPDSQVVVQQIHESFPNKIAAFS